MPGFNRAPSSFDAAGQAVSPSNGEVVAMAPQPNPPLSAQLWGLDLCRELPHVLTPDGITVMPGDLTRIRSFLAQEFPWFGEDSFGAAPNEAIVDAKHWYLESACDAIELRHQDRTIGVFVGAPEDWSSYYIRVFAVTQPYQRPALTRGFLRHVFDVLARHHVERASGDGSPANFAMARCVAELHFHVTGHQLSERWGPLVRYTKFLDPACEAAFMRRFAGIPPGGPTRTGKEEPP
jgi:hypothetical protein